MKNQQLAWALVTPPNPIFHWQSSELRRTQLIYFPDKLFPGKNIVEKSKCVADENIQVAGDITELHVWASS